MSDLLARLQDRRGSLSKGERRIDGVICGDPDFALAASITELAARAGVSPATVTRFVRHLDCENFAGLKVQLAQAMFVGRRYLPGASAGSRDALPGAARAAHDGAAAALSRTLAGFDAEVVAEAAERIASARAVAAFGSGGSSSMIAGELQNRLFRLGLAVTTCTDHQMQLMQAAAMGRSDVLIAASQSGRNLQLAQAMRVARDYGVHVIAMTRPGRPVAEAAHRVIVVDMPEHDDILRPTASRYAFLLATDFLATAVALARGAAARESLRRIKLNLALSRDENDTEALGD